MKKLLFIPIIALFLSVQSQDVKQVNSLEFSKLIALDNGVLLDVRTTSEYNNEYIANAGQLNYYAFDFYKKLFLLSKDEHIYIYCNTGYRSDRAAQRLIANGYTNVYNLEHGIMEWNLQNLPVNISPNAKPDMDNKMDIDGYYKLINSNNLVFIDFYAPWCAPCRRMMPMIDSLKVEYHTKIDIVKINADASKKLIKELKLIGVPYLAMYKKGELLYSKKGMVLREELVTVFDKN